MLKKPLLGAFKATTSGGGNFYFRQVKGLLYHGECLYVYTNERIYEYSLSGKIWRELTVDNVAIKKIYAYVLVDTNFFLNIWQRDKEKPG